MHNNLAQSITQRDYVVDRRTIGDLSKIRLNYKTSVIIQMSIYPTQNPLIIELLQRTWKLDYVQPASLPILGRLISTDNTEHHKQRSNRAGTIEMARFINKLVVLLNRSRFAVNIALLTVRQPVQSSSYTHTEFVNVLKE